MRIFGSVLIAAVALGLLLSRGTAAEFQIEHIKTDEGSIALITIVGELASGDDKQFVNLAIQAESAIVLLDSPGGNLVAGMEIGNAIRIKRFATLVPNEFQCASACALAWLGGWKRLMGQDARVGFHAASRLDDASGRPDSVGNALVGAYLNQLNLPLEAIAYITESAPSEMRWLTFEDAELLGIDVEKFVLAEEKEPDASSELRVPDGFWIQLLSRQTLGEIKAEISRFSQFRTLRGIRAGNGWYVLALGPFVKRNAELALGTLKANGSIPADSLITTGSNYVAVVWTGSEEGLSDVSPTRSTPRWATNAVEEIFRVSSLSIGKLSSSLLNLYDMRVVYYGKSLTRAEVIEDKRSFARRWPQRNYTVVPQSVTVECSSENACTVSGLVKWSARSPTRKATSVGTARFSYSLKKSKGEFRILSEESEVLERSVGSSK